jgi:NAD(P)-dependent dehydrogenase (short-subunit alcohol dehydrogenase family)
MDLSDRIVVVTGGASGIGRAMCERFAAAGARTVVVVDRDAEGATRLADGLGERGVALSADVGVEADVQAVVERTEDEVGPIDLFASNAGLVGGGGVEADDEVWSSLWSVNVMAHVYAARAVIPRMVERGGGYLLATASAAGLLTNLGNAPYSVTKHAAVGLAEWISITYGDQGIKVSCLCPMGVETPMLRAGAPAPGSPSSQSSEASPELRLAAAAASTQGVITPERVADAVVDGLRDERFLILPHTEVADYERRRAGARDRWLAGMRRLRASLLESQAEVPASPPGSDAG